MPGAEVAVAERFRETDNHSTNSCSSNRVKTTNGCSCALARRAARMLAAAAAEAHRKTDRNEELPPGLRDRDVDLDELSLPSRRRRQRPRLRLRAPPQSSARPRLGE